MIGKKCVNIHRRAEKCLNISKMCVDFHTHGKRELPPDKNKTR